MFEASIAPSAPPAPINVCISSMNIIMSSVSSSSTNTFFILSSNSPRYFVPATIVAISKDKIRLFFRTSGTLPSAIILLNSSTIAVLPTPASPISKGLFLVLLQSISKTLLISFSLPITGSNSLLIAFLVKSIASSSIKRFFLDLFLLINFLVKELYNLSRSTFILSNVLIATPSPSSSSEEKRCSTVTSPSLFSLLSDMAFSITLFNNGVYKNHSLFLEPIPIIDTSFSLKLLYSTPYVLIFLLIELSVFKIASSKCSLPT